MPDKSTELNKAVGRRLIQLREAHDYQTTRAFAEKLGVKEDRLSSWETGKNALPVWMAKHLCREFDATYEWIWDGDDRRLPPWLRDKIRKRA